MLKLKKGVPMKKTKQIGFLTALMISVGSTIGAGIFFKNGTIIGNADGRLGFTIATWVIAFIGILAIGIALIEVSSKSKEGNSGLLGWVQKFMPKKISKFSASYMLLVYLPLNYVALPIYAVMSLNDAIQAGGSGFAFEGYQTVLIGLGIFLWMAFMGFFKNKASKNIQWVFTVMKFIPLVMILIYSLTLVGDTGVQTKVTASTTGLTGISPWLGIMGSIPAIMFAVDGFYTVTAMKSEMKEPKKMGALMAISISIIMGAYLIFGVVTSLTGQGSYNGIVSDKGALIAINVFITGAVLGIVNGFAMSTYNFYESCDKENKLGFIKHFTFKGKYSDRTASFIASILFTIFWFIILTPIGLFALGGVKNVYEGAYGSSDGIYILMDLVTNFTSLFIFIFIGLAIFGALLNRKNKKQEVEKNKYFVVSAIVGIIFITIGSIYMLVAAFVDMFGVNGSDSVESIIKFAIMMLTISVAAVPLIIDSFKKPQTV